MVETKLPAKYKLDTTLIILTVDNETTVIDMLKYNVKVVKNLLVNNNEITSSHQIIYLMTRCYKEV